MTNLTEIQRLSLDLHEARETIANLRAQVNEWMLTATREANDASCVKRRVKELTAAVEGLLNALPSATTHPTIQAARAAHIAACHPDAIQALMAERDALREALQSIIDCCDEDHAARDYVSRQTEIRGIARFALAQGEA